MTCEVEIQCKGCRANHVTHRADINSGEETLGTAWICGCMSCPREDLVRILREVLWRVA